MSTKKKTTTKQATKRPARKTIEAFDAALDPPARKAVIAVEPILEAEDFNPYDPTQIDRTTELMEPQGEDRSEEVEDYGYPETPVAPPAPAPEPAHEPSLPSVSELEGPLTPSESFTLKEQARAVELLIDSINYLYPKAKRRILAKDAPILKLRVARGRQLVALLQS